MELRRTVLVAHPAERLYRVIEAAEEYPAFLPWCAGATILQRDDQLVVARIEIAWRGVRFSFVTRNPKRPPHWMAIGLEQGPFRRFEGTWTLTPLADWGCRVEFWLGYEFNAALLGPLAAPVFDHATNTLVDAFVKRADVLAAREPAPTATPTPAPAPAPAPAPPVVGADVRSTGAPPAPGAAAPPDASDARAASAGSAGSAGSTARTAPAVPTAPMAPPAPTGPAEPDAAPPPGPAAP